MLRLKGIIMIITGAMLWGATGPILEWLLGTAGLSVPFLLTIRLTLPGILLLVFLYSRKKDIFTVWKTAAWRNQLIIFSIFGMLALQFTFVSAIEASNAVVATLLQFSAPIFITVYVSLTYKKFPPRYQTIGIIGILIGLFLLMTNGSLNTLLVNKQALIWGITLGITFAFYTLYPARLMKEWHILIVVGWAMLISGIVIGMSIQVWNSDQWILLIQPKVALFVSLLLFFGTIAYVLFLNSTKYISAVETSILTSMEPLTAMVISAFWFGTILQSIQLLGTVLMLIFVSWLSIGGGKSKSESENNSDTAEVLDGHI